MNHFHQLLCRSSLWRKTLELQLLPWALKGLDPGDHILEIGPGPGLVNDYLRPRFPRITSVEIDSAMALDLGRRLRGTNASVVNGDGARLPFPDRTFSSALSFTMLHHVPTIEQQDSLLAEVKRVLRPGGLLAGTDNLDSWAQRLIHWRDTAVLVDPDRFGERLERAGFHDIQIRVAPHAFRFRARA